MPSLGFLHCHDSQALSLGNAGGFDGVLMGGAGGFDGVLMGGAGGFDGVLMGGAGFTTLRALCQR